MSIKQVVSGPSKVLLDGRVGGAHCYTPHLCMGSNLEI